MADEIVAKLLAGASLRCVMQPDDVIPGNRPLHDECFDLPHVIIDGENFSAIIGGNIVTNPSTEWPIMFYYTSYQEMFGTFDPVKVEPGFGVHNSLRMSFSPRKRYKKFTWVTSGDWKKIWDSQGCQELDAVRMEVLRAGTLKAVFLDEEDIWNIHQVVLPQVASNEDSFNLQTGYVVYPQVFRQTREVKTRMEADAKFRTPFEGDNCFGAMGELQAAPFHAFYQLFNNGTYKSYYDLGRGDTLHHYKRLMVFAEE